MRRPSLTDARGFTVVEALVASLIVLIGLVGTFTLVDAANSRSVATKAREGATNLAREVTEQMRTMRYDQLVAGFDVDLRTRPGLADASTAPGWQVSRRGVMYTIGPSVCAMDDGGDGYGEHSGGGFCPESSTQNTIDASPEDLKRVEVAVAFADRSGTTRTVRRTATVNSTGQARGLPVTLLQLKTPVVPDPLEPVVTTAATGLTFTARASATASRLVWALDGTPKSPNSPATMADPVRVNSTDWEFQWNLTGVSDGTYDVTVQAVDSAGELGPPRTIKVQLARNGASAPTDLVGGYNDVREGGTPRTVTELEWLPVENERNVVGYRVYRGSPGFTTLVCPGSAGGLSLATTCMDLSPPADTATPAERTYAVRALYYDGAGVLQESPSRTVEVKPTVVTTTTTSTVDTPRPLRFQIDPSAVTSTTNCPGTAAQNLIALPTAALASTTVGASGKVLTACTATAAEGDAITGLVRYSGNFGNNMGNGANERCDLTTRLSINGTVIATSPPRRFDNNGPFGLTAFPDFTINRTLTAGDRLRLELLWEARPQCIKVSLLAGGSNGGELFVDGTTKTTTSSTSSTTVKPNPPVNLRKDAASGGTVKLRWEEPAGPAVAFYRIYRGSTNHVDRVDTTGDPGLTNGSDPEVYDVPATAANYYITAVSSTLVESTPVGPISP